MPIDIPHSVLIRPRPANLSCSPGLGSIYKRAGDVGAGRSTKSVVHCIFVISCTCPPTNCLAGKVADAFPSSTHTFLPQTDLAIPSTYGQNIPYQRVSRHVQCHPSPSRKHSPASDQLTRHTVSGKCGSFESGALGSSAVEVHGAEGDERVCIRTVLSYRPDVSFVPAPHAADEVGPPETPKQCTCPADRYSEPKTHPAPSPRGPQ